MVRPSAPGQGIGFTYGVQNPAGDFVARTCAVGSACERPVIDCCCPRTSPTSCDRWHYADLHSLPPEPLPPVPDNRGALAFLVEPEDDNEKVGFYVASPDGQLLASATYGNLPLPRQIRLQKLIPGVAIDQLPCLPMKWRTRFQVRSLKFSEDGKRLLVMVDDRVTEQLMSCDLETGGAQTCKLPDDAHLRGESFDGSQFLVWQDHQLLVYDFHDREPKHRLDVPPDETELLTAAWSADGKKIAGAGHGKRTYLWDFPFDGLPQELGQSDLLSRMVDARADRITDMVFSSDGKSLVISDNFSTISLWKLDSKELVNVPAAAHEAMVHAGDISADGRIAVTCSRDGTARIWDAATGEHKSMLQKGRNQPPSSCRITPDGSAVAIANQHELVIYDLPSGTPKWNQKFSPNDQPWVRSLSFSGDGKRLAAKYSDDRAIVWEPEGNRKVCEIKPEAESCHAVCLSHDGSLLAVACKTEMAASTTITIWNVDNATLVRTLEPEKGNAASLRFSSDGKRLLMSGHSIAKGWVDNNRDIASPGFEDSLILWDLESGKVIQKYGWPACETNVRIAFDVVFTPDEQYLVTAERLGEVLIYETDSGKLKLSFRAHDRPTLGVAVSADGQRLLTVSTDQNGMVWDLPALLRRAQQAE